MFYLAFPIIPTLPNVAEIIKQKNDLKIIL